MATAPTKDIERETYDQTLYKLVFLIQLRLCNFYKSFKEMED